MGVFAKPPCASDVSALSSKGAAMTCEGHIAPHLLIGQADINSLISI